MNIGVYSLSLSDKTPQEIINLAKKYKIEGIEWWCKEKGHVDSRNLETSAKEVAKIMRNSNIQSLGIAPYFKGSETHEEIKVIFNAASILGAKLIRCHSYNFTGDIPVCELRKKQRLWLEDIVIPSAKQFDVKLVIEQHHYSICCTPDACRNLIEGLPSTHIGIIFDPGNSLIEGYTRPEYAIDVLGEYLAHVHVKSCKPVIEGGHIPQGRKYSLQWGKLEDGDLDWEEIIKLLHTVGYDGYLSLEALDQRESEQKIKEDVPYLQNIIRRLSAGGLNG